MNQDLLGRMPEPVFNYEPAPDHVFKHTITLASVKAASSRLEERGCAPVSAATMAVLLDEKATEAQFVEIVDSWESDRETYIGKLQIADVCLVAVLIRSNRIKDNPWAGCAGLVMMSVCTTREARKCLASGRWKTMTGEEFFEEEKKVDTKSAEQVCTKCSVSKPLTEFYKDRHSVRRDCKKCCGERKAKGKKGKVTYNNDPTSTNFRQVIVSASVADFTSDLRGAVYRAFKAETEALERLNQAERSYQEARQATALAVLACGTDFPSR